MHYYTHVQSVNARKGASNWTILHSTIRKPCNTPPHRLPRPFHPARPTTLVSFAQTLITDINIYTCIYIRIHIYVYE
jgi:hypothetical protein